MWVGRENILSRAAEIVWSRGLDSLYFKSLFIAFWVPKAKKRHSGRRLQNQQCNLLLDIVQKMHPCKARLSPHPYQGPGSPAAAQSMWLLRTAGFSPCPAAFWPGGFSCDSWEKFWRILETRSLDVHFTIATFNSKNKSVITISLSYCGANWICWKYRAKQVIWFITTDTSPHL